MDPAVYPEPDRFHPRRFLDPSYPTARTREGIEYGASRGHWAFGFGRRACPGQHIAERSMYIVSARLLWAFNLSKVVGADGQVITPDALDFSTGKKAYHVQSNCVHSRICWV
jgi:cytochrome P450